MCSSASLSSKALKTIFQELLIQNERTKPDSLKLLCLENQTLFNRNANQILVHTLHIHFESLCCACKQGLISVSSEHYCDLDKHKKDMNLRGIKSNLNYYKMWLGFQSTTSAVTAVPYFFLFDIDIKDLAAEL